MYKKNVALTRKCSCMPFKFLLTMKLVFIFLLSGFLQVSAAGYAQRVSISLKNAHLKEVFTLLRKQCGYDFLYNSTDLKNSKPVSLSVNNELLNDALEKCLINQNLVFKISGTTVLIQKKAQSVVPQIQLINLTGKVVDTDNRPISGVGVRVKSTRQGTVTDLNGSYKITVPAEEDVLIFSFVGFSTQEKKVGKNTTINVVLKEEDRGLDEVAIVQVGYGEVKRSDLTSSIASVNVTDLQKAPVRSFEEALAGRVAGVQVTGTDGQPGQPLNIVVRGNSSFNYDNSPLYIIDGFALENPDNNAINPAEIESIDILKDASATAIYGSRGANGVVIITTKKGKLGATVIAYEGYYGVSTVTKRMDLMGPYDFVRMQGEIDAFGTKKTYYVDGKTLESYRNLKGLDFQDEMFRNGPFSNHTLSARGGNDQSKFSLSGSLTDQDGVIVNSGFKRKQGRFNLEQKLKPNLKIFANVNYAESEQNGTIPRNQTASDGGGNKIAYNLLYNVWAYRPITGSGDSEILLDSFLDESDDPYAGSLFNPLASAKNESNMNYNSNFNTNGFLEYNINKEFTLKITGGISVGRGRNDQFYNTQTRSGTPLTPYGQRNGVNGSRREYEADNYSNENILSYRKKFNKHHDLTAMVVFSQQYNKYRSTSQHANKLPNENLGIDDLENGQAGARSVEATRSSLISLASRLNYSYMNRYLFNVNIRRDGSSKFRQHFGYFPSTSFAWKLGEERFMKNVSFLNNAKVRLSYGLSGNNRIGDFAYLSRIGTSNTTGFVTVGNMLEQIYYQTSLGNDDLKWETTKSFDVGIEFGLFKSRLNFEFDYYRKSTSDLLFTSNIANSTGFSTAISNVGSTRNEGLEFTLGSKNVKTKNFSWNSNFNISLNKNKLLGLSNVEEMSILSKVYFDLNFDFPSYIARVNHPMAMMYGYVYDGNYQYSDFYQSPSGAYIVRNDVVTAVGGQTGQTRADLKPGDPKYRDVNGDGKIDDNDRTVIGDPNPDFIGGFSNNFSYKNFDLNVFFQFSYGNDVLNANRLTMERSTARYNQFVSFNDRWTPDNPSNYAPRVSGVGVNVFSSRVIEDGSFLRLKTVSLGYNIPLELLKTYKIASVRAYTSAQNLWLWSNYSGPDPEANTKGFGRTPGFDFSAYPTARIITFGLNVTF